MALEVLVGGFPNSGTSFLCNLVAEIGFAPGSPQSLKRSDPHNRWGYWEHLPIREEVWRSFRGLYHPRDYKLPPRIYGDQAEAIAKMAAEDNVEVYKDCSLPFTYTLFPSDSKYLIIKRDWPAIIKYYTGPEESLYIQDALRAYRRAVHRMSGRVKTLCVRYEDFSSDLDDAIQTVCDFLCLPFEARLRGVFKPRKR